MTNSIFSMLESIELVFILVLSFYLGIIYLLITYFVYFIVI